MNKRQLITILGLILVLALTALPAAAQGYPNPGSGSTITELANKTDVAATVRVKYYNQGGGDAGTVERPVPGNGSVKIDPANTPLVQGFNGAGVASSDQPLAAVVETDWTGGPGDGFQMAFYSGVSAGSSRICFPSLWKGSAIISSFSVQNTGTAAANVSISYFSRTGAAEGTFTDTIPVGAQHSYDLATSPGPYGAVPNVAMGWEGSAVVDVTNGQTVAGVSVANYQGRSATYNAANCAGLSGATTLVVPSQYQVASNVNNASTYTLWSAVNVQNLENSPASVTLQYIPRSGAINKTINATIPALSAGGWNTRDISQFTDLGGAWDGTVIITSNKAIVATVITQWNRGGSLEADIYSAANQNNAATKYWLPSVWRIKVGSAFPAFSALLIQNIGNAPTTVTTKYYNRAGTNVHTFSEVLQPGAGTGYNTRGGSGGTSALGDSFEGHAVVESNGQPIAVVLNGIRVNPGDSATTNGIE